MQARLLAALLTLLVTAASPLLVGQEESTDDDRFDIVIYGGTSAGVIAAIEASERGKRVILIEPGRHLGGLSSGGLGATDIGRKAAIGGKAREFYRRIARHYSDDAEWKHEQRSAYRSGRQRAGEDTLWTFEPSVAESVFRKWLATTSTRLLEGERLDRDEGVTLHEGRIASMRLESGRVLTAAVFIDATYEGDLLAEAGVSYHIGREASRIYGETLNGVQTGQATKHQFLLDVDPWIEPGDPASGLLPGLHGGDPFPAGASADGAGDTRVQAYNFRTCLTDVAENRVAFKKPKNYDAGDYELLLRYFDAGFDRVPWHSILMPNRKTDTNNNHAFSTDFIGGSDAYPEADYATREKIVAAHRSYQEGLYWCLANEPRVARKVREEVSRWGLARDEFVDNGNWPHQIYVREARRMVGSYVMTQHECQGLRLAPDPVGLAAYTMDSHNVQRYVADGKARNEGDVQVGGFPPYPIAFGAIVPQRNECRNLLVPVCLSASHIAFGSIRMEPVFMVLGQSAATAACLAIDEAQAGGRPVAVQDIDRRQLREQLERAGQVLRWSDPLTEPVREDGTRDARSSDRDE